MFKTKDHITKSQFGYTKNVYFKGVENSGEFAGAKLDNVMLTKMKELAGEAKKTLEQAERFIRNYKLEDQSPLALHARNIRLTLKNDPEIQKARGNMAPEAYLRNRLAALKRTFERTRNPLEKEKGKFISMLKRQVIDALLSGNRNSARDRLRQLASKENLENKDIRLPRRFTFALSNLPGRTFIVLKNAQGNLTISFTRRGSDRQLPLCIGGRVIDRPAMTTILKLMKPTAKERREFAAEDVREKQLGKLKQKISHGLIASRDIYPVLRGMKDWPNGKYEISGAKYYVTVTPSKVLVGTDKLLYYTLYRKGTVSINSFAQHSTNAEILPYKLKRPKGAVARLYPYIVGPQYLKPKDSQYEFQFRDEKGKIDKVAQAKTKVHQVVGKPKNKNYVMTVEKKQSGVSKLTKWNKQEDTWCELDRNGKLTTNRLEVLDGDSIIDAYLENKPFA